MNTMKALFSLFIVPLFFISLPSHAAVFNVTSASCTGVGSITEAVNLANASPGQDTLEITPGLEIEADFCTPGPEAQSRDYFLARVTDSLIINGNGAKIRGHMEWVTSSGSLTPLDLCPFRPNSTDIVVSLSPGFLKVGEINQSNTGLEVIVRDLELQELNSIALLGDDAALVLEDVEANRILAGHRNCGQPAVEAYPGADVTLLRNNWNTIVNFAEAIPWNLPVMEAAIFGSDSGNILIEESTFYDVRSQGLIYWEGQTGTTANIISSTIDFGQGAFFSGAVQTNIVNTIWSPMLPFGFDAASADRIVNASSQDMNIMASTIMYSTIDCDSTCQYYSNYGWIRTWDAASGSINLLESAIGVSLPNDSPGRLLDNYNKSASGGFTADIYSWIQPVADQSAATFRTLTGQPALLTDAPGLPTLNIFASSLAEFAQPLVGTTGSPGLLIDAIPDANGSNQLLHPLSGLPITLDALGNPRVDGNGSRTIGAIQLTLAPHLSVTSTGDMTVTLSWSRPQDPPSGALTGYSIFYRLAGTSDSFTRTNIAGAATLTTDITGLTNGSNYEFYAIGVNASGDVPVNSNTVTGIPYGPILAPPVTATPGSGEVLVTWTAPDDGGRGIAYYVTVFRPLGSSQWSASLGIPAAGPLNRLVTGLTNGVTYEFGVSAVAPDGTGGLLGIATATPLPIPTLSYPSPVTIYPGAFASLQPHIYGLAATPSFSITAGTLPTGLVLNTSTGEISGTPIGGSEGSYSVTVTLTQAGLGAQFSTSAPVSIIVAPVAPNLTLSYPDIDIPAGSGSVSINPAIHGAGAGTAVYSIIGGEALPPGLSLNTSTGVITGVPTTATDGFRGLSVQVDIGAQTAVSPLIIRVQPTLSYSNSTGEVGTAMSLFPTVSGSTVTTTYALQSGTLPDGLTLNPNTGEVSGIPTISGTEYVTITATVTGGQTQTVTTGLSIVVNNYQITLTYPDTQLVPGTPVVITPTISGNKGTPSFQVVSGTLPTGLSLDTATGVISGTPQSGGTVSSLIVEAVDSYRSVESGVNLSAASASSPTAVPSLGFYGLLFLMLGLMGIGVVTLQPRRS